MSANQPTVSVLKRSFVVWLVIIAAEFLHATARIFLLQPLTGDFHARQITVFTGILIILTIAYLLIGWIAAASLAQLLTIGVMWLVMTVALEISLGRLMNLSWERIFSDYDLAAGGLMGFGLLFLTFAPLIAAKLKRKL